jgi:hypothetical protein
MGKLRLRADRLVLFEAEPGGFVPNLERMLNADYDARGWVWDTEKSSHEKLIKLEVEDIAKDLWG